MSIKLNIQKWGNSAAVRLPAAMLVQMSLKVGDAVEAEVSGDSIILRMARSRYTAKDLNAQCDLRAPMPDDLLEWEQMPVAGGS